MARPQSRYPTELELDILKILWRDGSLSGRQIRDALAASRELAYTSVMTIMKIMTEKEYVERAKEGGNYLYSAIVCEGDVSRGMMSDLVERVFDGSASAAMLSLLEEADIDSKEIAKIRTIINRKSRGSEK